MHGARFTVHAPLQMLSKADIVRRGLTLGLDYGLTHSCYDPLPDGAPCGRPLRQLRAAGGWFRGGRRRQSDRAMTTRIYYTEPACASSTPS